MSATIWYETPDGTDSMERDEWHIKNGMVAAYNQLDGEGVTKKVAVPQSRVVRIDG